MNKQKLIKIAKQLDLGISEKPMIERVAENYTKEEIENIIDKVINCKDINNIYSYTDEILQGSRIKSSRPDVIKKGLLDILNKLLINY